MMKSIGLIVLTFLISMFYFSSAQQLSYIPLNVDYATFRTANDEAYVELYVSFLQNALMYTPTDSGYSARFRLSCEITQAKKTFFTHDKVLTHLETDEQQLTVFRELRHILVCTLPPGKFQGKLSVTDLQNGRKGEYLFELSVPDYSQPGLQLSDIQLSLKISRDDTRSLFNKNGLRIIPNPPAMYSITMPVLYYYAEVYHLPYQKERPGQYVVETYITDKNGEVVRTFPTKTHQKMDSTAVIVGGNNIVTLSSDIYFFTLKVTDRETGASILKQKRFTFVKPTKEQLSRTREARSSSRQLMLSYYLGRSEEELDDEFDKVRYICTDEEKKVFKSLNFKGKAEFLVNFWRKRDPDPETPENEYKMRYFQLISYANATFSTKFRDGWKTDRGRVLLVYGPPDEIERHPSQQDSKPYEIWTYNDLEGGSIFVFGDLQGFGNYELLHSTYSQELNQPDWERLILKRNRRIDEDQL